MRAAALSLLACPRCRGPLDQRLECHDCNVRYDEHDGIAELLLPADARTERVRAFYTDAPFPDYPRRDSIEWLRARAERSRFARLLDQAVPFDARIADIGCGTGQMSLYLARGGRIVIGADLCRASLDLAAAAARRLDVEGVSFVETDIFRAGLRVGAFDLVYCSGVLHHTPDPRAAFLQMTRLAKPGGLIVVGLYNRFARLPHRFRRLVATATGGIWTPGDAVLAEREQDRKRRRAWLRDQYHHPEEHRHSLGQLRRWFADAGVEYLRSVPGALIGKADGDDGALTEPESGGWWLEDMLAQIGWIGPLAHEGGLFVVVGRAHDARVRSAPPPTAATAPSAEACAA